jgi:UDP-perosamine 4-acetyltransferase
METIIFIGGGGHAKVLMDLVLLAGQYRVEGILDSGLRPGTLVQGVPVMGNEDLLVELHGKGIVNACVGVGSIRDNSTRKGIYERLRGLGFSVPALIHPRAIVSRDAGIAAGVQVMAGAVVQPGARIDDNTIINSGAVVDHDCMIGKHVHVCPGAVLSGGVVIGDSSFIGAGVTVVQGVKIGQNAVIGAGSVVIRDVADGAVVKGVPAG